MTNHKTMSHFATEADYWKFKYEELRTEARDDRTMAVRRIVDLEAALDYAQEARKTAEIKVNIADLESVLQQMTKEIEWQVEQLSDMVQKMKCCGNCKHLKDNISCLYGHTCKQYSMWSLKE